MTPPRDLTHTVPLKLFPGPGRVQHPSKPSPDVLIIGGGVIGLAIAYELAKQRVKVTILEQGLVGSGSSHASAGMLAPLSDSYSHPPLAELGVKSFRIYPTFLKEAEEAAGITAERMPTGVLRLATTLEEEQQLRDQLPWAKQHALPLEWVGRKEATTLEPLLAGPLRGATFSPSEHQLSPTRLVAVLRRAAIHHGADIHEQTPVIGLKHKGGQVTSVHIATGDLPVGTLILASGAWAGLQSAWLGLRLPLHPVRGQVAYLNKLPRPLRHTVMHGDTYAVPKGDGTTLVGTTLEHTAGYDQQATVAGVAGFLTRIQTFLPSLGDATLNHLRAGLRPAAADELPILGPTPAFENLYLALGHYRSGILLSAITAKLLATSILQGGVDFGPFAASRLARD